MSNQQPTPQSAQAHTWPAYLGESGPQLDAEGLVKSFSNHSEELQRAHAGGNIAVPLPDLGVIDVGGEDATSFLQGQLTNDVATLDEQTSQWGAWCTAKGRVHALIHMFRHDHGYRLILPRSQSQEVAKRLTMFVLRAKVRVQESSNEVAVLGIAGSNCVSVVESLHGPMPDAHLSVTHSAGLSVIRLDWPYERYVLLANERTAIALWSDLQTYAAGGHVWRSLNTSAGLVDLHTDDQDTFLPQMLNLQAIGAVNFTKGCYVGQEIVARTQHLGKLKRQLFKLRISATDKPKRDHDIIARRTDKHETIGRLIQTSVRPDGDFNALAVMKIDAVEQDRQEGINVPALELEGVNDSKISIQTLPYSIAS